MTFPTDWDEWRKEWREWKSAHSTDLRTTPVRFPDKNFLADEILGTWDIKGRTVELSEMTFPNLSERDERGILKHYNVRGIGVTFGVGPSSPEGAVVHSFDELEYVLGLKRPSDVEWDQLPSTVRDALDPGSKL